MGNMLVGNLILVNHACMPGYRTPMFCLKIGRRAKAVGALAWQKIEWQLSSSGAIGDSED